MTPWEKLNSKIEKSGGPKTFTNLLGDPVEPVTQYVNFKLHADEWIDLLIEYFPRMEYSSEQDMIVRALGSVKTPAARGKAARFLIQLFKSKKKVDEELLWSAANSIAILNDKATYPDVVELVAKGRLKASMQMMLIILGRAKTKRARQGLLRALKHKELVGHAITALGIYGDPSVVPMLKRISLPKGHFGHRARETAIKRLKKKA